MKKIFTIFIILIISISCNTPVEYEKVGGEWLREGSRLGKGYIVGDKQDSDLARKFMDAYENMDAQLMIEFSADTVMFHPADIGGVFDVDMTNTDFIVERQSNWDSLSRDYIFIMPLKLEDDFTRRIVTTAFEETRYIKDGSTETNIFYERLSINEEDLIERVVQYSRPAND
tara:strand:- start:6289 stop:6804 length:516 start_codon:yes stop_codon:yes gene_type:complete